MAPYFGPLFDGPPTGASELLPKRAQKVVRGVHEKGSKTPLFGVFLGSFLTPFLDPKKGHLPPDTGTFGVQKWAKNGVKNGPF